MTSAPSGFRVWWHRPMRRFQAVMQGIADGPRIGTVAAVEDERWRVDGESGKSYYLCRHQRHTVRVGDRVEIEPMFSMTGRSRDWIVVRRLDPSAHAPAK